MATLSGALRRAGVLLSAFVGLPALLLSAVPAVAASDVVGTPVLRYATVLRSFNAHLSAEQSKDMAAHVLWLSSYYSLDPRLLVAIVGVESSWRSGAVSPAGAQGLGQLMPGTAGALHVLAFDAYENLDGTARYLRRMMQRYAGRSTETRNELALASYNAGPQAVANFGGIPPYAETRAYVGHVMDLWHRLEVQLPAAEAPAPAIARAGVRPAPARRSAGELAVRVTAEASLPGGSVASFTQLEVQSLQILAAVPIPTPSVREPAGLRRWLARAFHAR